MDDFKGKVAVVTGAASGIGRALALQLTQEGCVPVVVDLDGEGLKETCGLLAGYSQPVISHVVDVGNRGQVFTLAERVARDREGPIF